MQLLLIPLVLIVLSSVALAAPSGVGLDVDRDFFPILAWDRLDRADKEQPTSTEEQIRSLAECNFTVAAFARPEDLPLIQKMGMKAILHPGETPVPWKTNWKEVKAADAGAGVRQWLKSLPKHPAILGYYLKDEPGTPLFPALAEGVAAVKELAPGKLAYINLFPGYATIGNPNQSQLGAASFTDYLERFVSQVKPQILSYDNYKVMVSDDLQDMKHGQVYFSDLLEVRRVSQKHQIPFWNVICANQIRNYTSVPTPANLMLQAYTTLAAGGRGISWYTYFQRGYDYAPIDRQGRRTETWQWLSVVNSRIKVLGPLLNDLESTGVFFTDPAPKQGMPLLPGRIVKSIAASTSARIDNAPKPPLMVGEFKDSGGNDWVMVVNLSLQFSARVQVATTETYSEAAMISSLDGAKVPIKLDEPRWLAAGEGMLISLK